MADYTNIIQEINTNLPDNTEQLITAEILRETLIDFVNEVEDTEDDLETAIQSKQDTLTFDNTPTDNSTNPVTSGGIYNSLSNKADKVSNATNGNFAGLDSNGNITDSGSNASDFATAAQGALASTAYQKPSTGIPASDLASGVIPDVSGFITNNVDNLVNYYLKSETYSQTEVNALIGAIQQFHYEIYQTLPATGASNVLYLIGPSGSGSDKYEEYVYANNAFTKIGDTSIDLSGYVTTTALNNALADYTTTANLTTLLAGKQDTISDLATIRSGAALGATAYQKPSTGIPASDLASGVIPDISGKADKTSVVTLTETSVTQELLDNTIYQASELASLTITIPNGVTTDYISQINFASGSTATTLTAPNTIVWYGDDIVNNVFVPVAGKQYVVIFYYDGTNVRSIVQSH